MTKCINCNHEQIHHIESGIKIDYINNMSKCYMVVTDNPKWSQPYVCPCMLFKPEQITE